MSQIIALPQTAASLRSEEEHALLWRKLRQQKETMLDFNQCAMEELRSPQVADFVNSINDVVIMNGHIMAGQDATPETRQFFCAYQADLQGLAVPAAPTYKPVTDASALAGAYQALSDHKYAVSIETEKKMGRATYFDDNPLVYRNEEDAIEAARVKQIRSV